MVKWYIYVEVCTLVIILKVEVKHYDIFSCLYSVACGLHCGIKPLDPIRCRDCGYRILYKIRTKRCKFYNYFYFLPLVQPIINHITLLKLSFLFVFSLVIQFEAR